MNAMKSAEKKAAQANVTITTDPSRLKAALAAVRLFVSKDSTRASLRRIHAETTASQLRLTATNGHVLCTVAINGDVSQTGPINMDEASVERLLVDVKLAKCLSTAPFTLVDSAVETTFPAYDRVQPPKHPGGKADRVQSFNGEYLALIGAVQKALKATGARIQMGETHHPMRADVQGAWGDAIITIMPMSM